MSKFKGWKPKAEMKTASAIFAALSFAAFYESCASNHEFNPGGVVFGLILLLLSGICRAIADKETKIRRDTDAKVIVEKVMNGEDTDFYLYLRPFVITNKLPMQNPQKQSIQDTFHPERVRDFETILTQTLEECGIKLIALGKPGETVGAGRYETNDENWQALFEKLASAASRILLVPSLHSGTMFEVQWLVENKKIGDAIFLQPTSRLRLAEPWESVVRAYNEIGLTLPGNQADVVDTIFRVGEEGQVIVKMPVSSLWSPKAGTALNELSVTEQVKNETRPENAVITAIPTKYEPINRPSGIGWTALLMFTYNTIGGATTMAHSMFVSSQPQAISMFSTILQIFLIFLGYFFIWFYWQGKNWARIAVLLRSALSVYGLRYWNQHSPTTNTKVTLALGAALGIFLLYWLNTRRAMAFFSQGVAKSNERLA